MALTDVKSEQIQSSVALAGSPTTTTQSASDNSTKIATTAYVDTAVTNLVASAPAALNTLDELAAALNDDASFSTTVTNSIATKAPLASPSLTGTVTITGNFPQLFFVDTAGSDLDAYIVNNANGLFIGKTNTPNSSNDILSLDLTNQRVGIGVSPSVKFNVDVGAPSSSDQTLGLFQSQTARQIGFVWDDSASTLGVATITAHDLVFHTSGNSNEKMRITTSGRVGIGTTSPSANLTITDENAGQATIQARNFATSATGSFGNAHAFEFRAATSTTTHGMLVALNENNIGRRSLEVADSTGIFATFVQGKLGIGRNNPSARLHLQSTGSATYSGSSAGTNIGLYLTNAESGAAGRTIGIGLTCESNAEIYLNAVTAANNNGGDFVIASRNGGTRAEKMRVHAAGSVTKPLNPSFHVRYPGTTALDASGGVAVVYNSVFHNVGSHYNTSNGRFTAPVTGVYVFHAQVRVDGFAGNYSYLTLEHYSSTGTQQANKARDLQDGNNSSYLNHIIAQNVYLLANEYVQIQYRNNGDSSVALDSDSYFSGYLLG